MIEKDYDAWNTIKKKISTARPKHYHTRDIWWSSIGLNIGDELDGTGEKYGRPILIVKSINQNTCIIVPLTTSETEHKYRIHLGGIGSKESYAAISQLRVIDTRRLLNKITKLDKNIFDEIRKAVRDLF